LQCFSGIYCFGMCFACWFQLYTYSAIELGIGCRQVVAQGHGFRARGPGSGHARGGAGMGASHARFLNLNNAEAACVRRAVIE